MLKHIFSKKNKALLSELVRTDFKLRYQGSVLGYTWSLLRPLFMFAILYIVFGVVFKIGEEVPNFSIYLLLGIVLWSFFQEMTSQSLGAIVGRGDLIRKIRIPRWLIIVSASVSALINLCLNLVVVLIFAILSGMDFLITSVYLPLFVFEIYLLALGLSLLLSALYVRFRDVSHIWDVVLQAGFYATPILYPVTLVENLAAQKAILLNPLAQAVQGARDVFVTNQTTTMGDVWGTNFAILIPLALVFFLLLVGTLYFKDQSKYFAENL